MTPGYYYLTTDDGHQWILGLTENTRQYMTMKMEKITDQKVIAYLEGE